MAMLVQYLSAKVGVATGRDLPELCRELFPRTVTPAAVGSGRADRHRHRPGRVRRRRDRPEPAVPRAAAGGGADDRRGRVRHPRPCSSAATAGSSWPSPRCSASCRSASPTTWPQVHADPASMAAGLVPTLRPSAPAAGLRHHRGHGHAARHLPALGPDQVPGDRPRRRRAPRAAEVPAARRGGRAGRGRPDQPGHAVRGGRAVLPYRVLARRIRSSRRTPGWRTWSAAAPRWPSRWRCSLPGCPPPAWAPTPARSSCRASSRRRIPVFARRDADHAARPGRAGAQPAAPPAAWSSPRSCCRSASRSRWCRWCC